MSDPATFIYVSALGNSPGPVALGWRVAQQLANQEQKIKQVILLREQQYQRPDLDKARQEDLKAWFEAQGVTVTMLEMGGGLNKAIEKAKATIGQGIALIDVTGGSKRIKHQLGQLAIARSMVFCVNSHDERPVTATVISTKGQLMVVSISLRSHFLLMNCLICTWGML
jgi:uncharacterized protein Veg